MEIMNHAEHEPTFEEAEEFIKEDLKRLGYDGIYGITPITEHEVHQFFDDSNIDNWKVMKRWFIRNDGT